MSWRLHGSRDLEPPGVVRGLSLLLAAAPALAACGNGGIRPLYGATPSGAGMQERMAQVDVAPIPGRVGQRIRNELIFLSHRRRRPAAADASAGGDDPRVGHPDPRQDRRRLARADLCHRGLLPADQHQGQEGGASRAPATPAPASSASRRSTPTCARATMPRTAPRAPSPTTSSRGSRPICPARREPVLRRGQHVRFGARDGRNQDASGPAFLNALERVPAGRAVLWHRRGLGLRAGGAARQGPCRARRPQGRDPSPRR